MAGYTRPSLGHGRVKVGVDQSAVSVSRCKRVGTLRYRFLARVYPAVSFTFFFLSSERAAWGGRARRQTFSFFSCSADHERDWPPCKVVFCFFRLASNTLKNGRNNNSLNIIVCHEEVLSLQSMIPSNSVLTFPPLCGMLRKQPIMPTEDRLFDRGWVRSAMGTRKCGSIYFPKYFMAVRPFFKRIFFQELFGLEGSKKFLEKIVRCTI